MGGYSSNFIDNLTLLQLTMEDIDSIIPGIQKIVITKANSTLQDSDNEMN